MLFYLQGNSVNADIATYLAYKAIEVHMMQDKYIGIVPTILLLTYLSPFPLVLPPAWNGTDSVTTSSSAVGSTIGVDKDDPAIIESTMATAKGRSVSPWTIAACVATLLGGVLTLLVNNRKPGNRGGADIQVTTQSHHGRRHRR